MAKNNRGKGLWGTPGRARGQCPVCHRTGVKLLYARGGDQSVKVCKRCRHTKAA
jgi:hypothetical protein